MNHFGSPPYTLFIIKYQQLLSLFSLADGATHGDVSYRSSNEERRQGTEDNTQNHSEREAADGVTTEDEDTEQHDQGRYRGVDGTSQRLVQRVVEQCLTVALAEELDILTDTVEDHHLIVNRVTNHGQDSTNEVWSISSDMGTHPHSTL